MDVTTSCMKREIGLQIKVEEMYCFRDDKIKPTFFSFFFYYCKVDHLHGITHIYQVTLIDSTLYLVSGAGSFSNRHAV